MNTIKQMERINKANQLILNSNTGNPDDFAEKLNVSRSQLYNILEQFKDFGAPIKYNKKDETFYYETIFNLELKYSLKTITADEEKIIFAGFFQNPILLDGTTLNL
jgi:predicted DNA-binding transcriptional regulator YafY